MTFQDKAVVGKRGEILPKKTLREASGIKPGDEVLIEAHQGKLVIKKIYSVEEALAMPTIATGTPDTIERAIEEERERQEKFTNEDH